MDLPLSEVSAVIVTKGDVDLGPIIDTLPYADVHVWDNSETVFDAKTFGRWLCAERTQSDVFYFQDDDILFTDHNTLHAAYDPDRAVVNMPSPWYERVQESWASTGRPLAMFGGGCLVPRHLARDAFAPYLKHFHSDDLFLELCDLIGGTFMPFKRVDLGFEILPQATYPDRIATSPGHIERRAAVRQRVAAIVAELQKEIA